MSENSKGTSVFSIIIGVLLFATAGVSVLFWQSMNVLNSAYADMNQIEFISSSTQRLISIAQTEPYLQKDVFFIGESTEKALKPSSSEALTVLDNIEIVLLANAVIESWDLIESLLGEEDPNTIDLSLARDAHFKAMTDLSNAISAHTKDLNNQITVYQGIVLGLIFLIAIIMLNNILRTHAELRNSQRLAKTAQIDTATGLYNRSRCQELFKTNANVSNKKRPAILVLDLNDLKKTNDSLGHRAGDELIQSFANVLKDACNVHVVPPFIGRYGGDEFIIFYEDVASEDDIKTYIKELDFLTKNFNDKESKFQLSYAVGYAYIASDSEERLTTRQLFDKADEAMYENKIAGKRAKNPNYDEEVAKGEVR